MLTDKEFLDGIWEKYDAYTAEENKDKFYKKHWYRNTDFLLRIRTILNFLIAMLATAGVVYAGLVTYKMFIQKNTTTDFSKNQGYHYSQDMTYSNEIYYKNILSFDEYKELRKRWSNLVDMTEEDFNSYFVLVIASEMYDNANLFVTDINADDNTLYVELNRKDLFNEEDSVISTKVSKELYRENIVIRNNSTKPDIDNFVSIEDLPKVYTKEQAIADGCFVIEDNEIISNNPTAFKEFVERTQNGNASMIRVVVFIENYVRITDVEYKNGVYKMCRDDSRGETGEINYIIANRLKVENEIQGEKEVLSYYYLIDEMNNQTLICTMR